MAAQFLPLPSRSPTFLSLGSALQLQPTHTPHFKPRGQGWGAGDSSSHLLLQNLPPALLCAGHSARLKSRVDSTSVLLALAAPA